ncbi:MULTISPECIES: response regulator [unclassified Duganella]|uniref:response regulator n=1 Tax=unclassified Duganella TaxID=2636909 RepID=UPI000884EC36|nr:MULTISPECIES: response regulator [unclassified Duganella]SDG01158.1 Response regulator receiver domain-containing protein [Duganella sp. OV458]SDJ03943.1 Response regulator receiver domain-containing protein [Duganella sp. OV510]
MHLPVYAHPTLTVLVDDSDSFLRSLSFQLDPMLANKTFHDTTEALHWLRASAPDSAVPLHVNFDMQNLPADQCNVALDLERIYRIAEQRERFATPSVLVVDYSMPQMNGLEFCAAVAHLPCKKILFTGAADEKVAVSAFNRGLIDRYIKKSDDHALDILEMEIATMQDCYFDSRSDILREMVALHDYRFLTDAALAEVVRELKRSLGFVEHYIFPNPTGVLFLDQHGKATLMAIETEQSMQSQYEIARDSEAPRSLLRALLERRVLTFFSAPFGDGMYSSGMAENWHRYSAAPHICHGKETYYWALFDLPGHYFDQRPYAYAQFVQAQQPISAAA